MTLLELIQDFSMEVGVPAPNAVIGSLDPTVTQALALAQRLGRDMARDFEWQELDKEGLITTVAVASSGDLVTDSPVITNIPDTSAFSVNWGVTGVGAGIAPFAQIVSVDSATQITMNMAAQATATGQALTFAQVQYPLPSDWLKQIPQTEWDRTDRWPLIGPISPQDWQSFKSGIVYAGPRLRFRILDNTIAINPPPGNALTLAFEYISNGWALSPLGVPQARFTNDADTFVYDPSLMVAGLKLRWLQTKGFEYGYAERDYRDRLSTCRAQNKSAQKLSLAPTLGSILLTNRNIPDGGWPG